MKRAYTRGEKALFLAPLLLAMVAGGVWKWRESGPTIINVSKESHFGGFTFSPDGKRLAAMATIGHRPSSSGSRPVGWVYDLRNGSEVCELEVPKSSSPMIGLYGAMFNPTVRWSPEGNRLVAGYVEDFPFPSSVNVSRYAKKIAVWDADDGHVRHALVHVPVTEDSESSVVHFSPDGNRLLAQSFPPTTFDAHTGEALQVQKGDFPQPYRGLQNEKNGLLALLFRYPPHFQVYDPKTKRVLWETSVGMVYGFAWRGEVLALHFRKKAQGKQVAKGSDLLLWDGRTRRTLPSPTTREEFIGQPTLNRDGRRVAFTIYKRGDSDSKGPSGSLNELTVWDYRQGRELWRIRQSSGETRQLEWSPDGKWLMKVQQGDDLRLLVFDEHGKQQLDRPIADLAANWSPDSKSIATTQIIRRTRFVGWSRTQVATKQIVIIPVGE